MMDFHCHVDLYPKAREVYEQTARRNEFTWLVTTSPKAFAATSRVLNAEKNVLITPGLHPEIAHERAAELELLLVQIAETSAVGEIGLDGSSRFRPHYDVQKRIFRATIARCAELGGRLISIHSRQAVKDVLEVLEQNPGYGTAVFHWFSGNLAELRAVAAKGCWFSVGPAMFESANGKKLASMMPRNRVVSESDGPFATVDGQTVMPWCARQTAERLSVLWEMSPSDAHDLLTKNGRELIKLLSSLD